MESEEKLLRMVRQVRENLEQLKLTQDILVKTTVDILDEIQSMLEEPKEKPVVASKVQPNRQEKIEFIRNVLRNVLAGDAGVWEDDTYLSQVDDFTVGRFYAWAVMNFSEVKDG